MSLLKKRNGHNLFEVVTVNSLSVFIRLILGLITSKFMAIFIGPSGLAVTGNLSNFMKALESLSSLGFKNGIIKYIAESREDKVKYKNVISSGFLIALAIGILLTFALFFFSNWISQLVFNTLEYSFLFKLSALMMPLFSIHIFFIAVINGQKKVNDLIQINIAGYICSAALIIFLMYKHQLGGALLAIVITPLVLFCSLFFKYKLVTEIFKNISFYNISRSFLLKISSFFSMTLFSGIMFPVIFLFVRNYIIDNVGLEEAGYWEAMRKISNYYMLFVYTLLEIHLLPLLVENKSNKGFRTIVLDFYKILLPLVFLSFIIIYLLKFIIIKLILTDEFFPMQELFIWQLVGDFFRIIFLAISYQFLAKKMIRLYIICEIVYMMIIYFSSIYLINYFGVLGAVKAHAFSSLFYMLLMFFVFRNEFFKKEVIN